MIIVTFSSYSSARTQLDEWNILANVGSGNQLAGIYINETEDTWAINGTSCIENGGLGRDQIIAEVEQLPSFSVDTYDDFFNLGYTPIN